MTRRQLRHYRDCRDDYDHEPAPCERCEALTHMSPLCGDCRDECHDHDDQGD